jgi:hypothetical protein
VAQTDYAYAHHSLADQISDYVMTHYANYRDPLHLTIPTARLEVEIECFEWPRIFICHLVCPATLWYLSHAATLHYGELFDILLMANRKYDNASEASAARRRSNRKAQQRYREYVFSASLLGIVQEPSDFHTGK